MPFGREFDDVYAVIKAGVERALDGHQIKCFRLDEIRPAGRITDRLLNEIRAATLCVADVSGSKPNVMWEVGYAMALSKPTVFVTQRLADLPFDLRDMQALEYDRNFLRSTLEIPLLRLVIDTMQEYTSPSTGLGVVQARTIDDKFVGDLLEEVQGLKSMISQLVKVWSPGPEEIAVAENSDGSLAALEGAWFNRESGSHHYAKMIRGDLVVPYCYEGDQDLTAVYYGWRRTGDYWFGRFAWLKREISGFTFLRQDSVDVLSGSWWFDHEVEQVPEAPIRGSGVPSRWERLRQSKFPAWAARFLEDVKRDGLEAFVIRR